jgi:protein-S-isoprenylcysteine O-methyltransferase Ste14
MNRRRLADETIRIGVLLQVVFLALVDWGTIAGIADASETPWKHVIGLVVVNVVLLASALVAWRWMGRSQRKLRRADPHAGT